MLQRSFFFFARRSCSEQSTFHGQASDRVWSFPNCSFKASRRKKRKKRKKEKRKRKKEKRLFKLFILLISIFSDIYFFRMMIFRQNPFLHARVGPAQGGGEKFSRGSFPSGFPGRQRGEVGFPERPVLRRELSGGGGFRAGRRPPRRRFRAVRRAPFWAANGMQMQSFSWPRFG